MTGRDDLQSKFVNPHIANLIVKRAASETEEREEEIDVDIEERKEFDTEEIEEHYDYNHETEER